MWKTSVENQNTGKNNRYLSFFATSFINNFNTALCGKPDLDIVATFVKNGFV